MKGTEVSPRKKEKKKKSNEHRVCYYCVLKVFAINHIWAQKKRKGEDDEVHDDDEDDTPDVKGQFGFY